MGGAGSKAEDEEVGILEAFIERLRVTLNLSDVSADVRRASNNGLERVKSAITSAVIEAGEQAYENNEDFEQKLQEKEEEILQKVEEIQAVIEEKIEEEQQSGNDEKLNSIVKELTALLAESNTVAVSRKQWRSMDLVEIHESTGLYVVEATPGYFKDKKNPAYMMLRTITDLISAIKDPENRLTHLTDANEKFELAWWEGIDPHSNQLKPGFLVIRKDKNSLGEASYNKSLGTIAAQAERMHDETDKDDKIKRNICSAMRYIVISCATPETDPFQATADEQSQLVQKARAAISFALAKQKRVRR